MALRSLAVLLLCGYTRPAPLIVDRRLEEAAMLGAKTCKCGRRNPVGARYCNACGEPLSSPRRRRGCLGRLVTTALALVAGAIVLSQVVPGGLGLSLGDLWPLTAPLSDGLAAPDTTTPLTDDQAQPTLTPGQRLVSYTVTAAADAMPVNVVVDYVATAARPAHAEVTLPWQHEAPLAPGVVARLVAEADAGQAFVARIYVAGELRAEAEAEPVAAEAGQPTRWRAQVEAPLAP
jgi:hypothetical protein